MSTALEIVILAAGQGTRLKSTLPKVLHCIGGRPLLAHVIQTAATQTAPEQIVVVYGHGGETVRSALADTGVQWALQAEQLGTGHAVAQALPLLQGAGVVLVLCGDVPLVKPETLRDLVARADANHVALLTVELAQPTGYGRIVRNADGQVLRIVEEKDADAATRAIHEINTGILALPYARLADWLPRLGNHNAQGEYYLTDLIGLAVADGVAINAVQTNDPTEVEGINTREQLAKLERVYQQRQASALMAAGVTLRDPARFDLRGELSHGIDIEIDVNVVLEGQVSLGSGVKIGPNCVIRNAQIGAGCVIDANSVIEESNVGAHSRIGPFARLRPGTELAEHVHVGNFVELKKALVGQGSKVNHLSYVGDAVVGTGVNVGAGTITCNYDGANKHQTVIEDGAFIGSNTQLVAPVRVGKNATIGAGSTISRDAPAEMLTVSRAQQVTVPGWKRKTKKGS